ncbi:NAD(P)-binding domain-containing protein [Candidatus Zixiibacteriota bacterium]
MLIYIIAALITVFIPFIYFNKYKKQTSSAASQHENNLKTGITEPVTLHPKIDVNSCIATGACVRACPEGEILGIVNGRARIISPTKCIGHGACQSACPTDAISLVFGTSQRGVDLPVVKETFETNVPGIFIAGELGGMGLVRNAITQGREAVEYISKSIQKNGDNLYDLLIVGAGPAGIAAGLQAKKENLKYCIIEQEADLGGTVFNFPRQKIVMIQPMIIPLYGKFTRREIQKEELLSLWKTIVEEYQLDIITSQKVDTITGKDNNFIIETNREQYRSKKALLTIGRRGTPRKLGVSGENSTKVTYKLLDPVQYKNKHLLVVGGGDSAIEAAITLGEQKETTVTLSYRKDQFSRIKDGNRQRIDAALKEGWVEILFNSKVKEIKEHEVILSTSSNEKIIKNDYVFVLIGGELPTKFLQNIGITMETKYGVA